MQGRPRRTTCWLEERGSQALQAAGAALVAALLVTALLAGASYLGPAVERAFACAASVLGGGGMGCGAGGVATTDAGSGTVGGPISQPPASETYCAGLPNAGLVNLPQPQNTADLYRNITTLYQQDTQTPETQKGPIGITRIGTNRYLVTLAGTEWQSGKFNNIGSAVRDEVIAGSSYQRHVSDVIRAHIPPGAEIVFAGHSLGGMVGQNLTNDPRYNLRGEYRITNVVTYGSPVTWFPADGVDYRMYEVRGDLVPGAAIVQLPGFIDMYRRGYYHIIPSDRFYWNPFSYHSAYAKALDKLKNDPQYQSLLGLPFPVDEWGPTYTYQANQPAADQLKAACP